MKSLNTSNSENIQEAFFVYLKATFDISKR